MIRATGKEFELPAYKLLNALLRKNRRYFNGEESNFVNLFFSSYSDDFPDPFVRIDLLLWLRSRNSKEGPTRNKGMFPVREIVRDMQFIGHNNGVTMREINYLIKRGLILSESLMSSVSKYDLIKIAVPGMLHLKLLSNITYLSACAEDVLFKNTTTMTAITQRLATSAYLSKLSMALTADEMIHYLELYKNQYSSHPEIYIKDGEQIGMYDLCDCKNAISKWIDDDKYVQSGFESVRTYTAGARVAATVVNKNNGSLVCTLGAEQTVKGFISALDPQYQLDYSIYETISESDVLEETAKKFV